MGDGDLDDGVEPRGLQRELDRLSATVGRSVSLDDPDGTLLAYSSHAVDADTVRIHAILTRRIPAEVLAYQRDCGIDSATSPLRVAANPDIGMAARVGLPIRHGRRIIGHLWVLDDEDTLDAPAMRAIAATGRNLRTLLRPTPTSAVDRAMRQLFADRPPADLAEHLLGRRSGAGHLLRFDVTIVTDTTADGRGPVTDVGARLPTPRSAIGSTWHQGQHLRLTPAGNESPPADRPDDPPTTATPGRTVARSAEFSADTTTAAALTQMATRAAVAAGCAAVDSALPAVLTWDDLGPYRRLLLDTACDRWPEPSPIADDSRSAETLLHTYETYLDHGGDAARCIAALGVHRTTYYYRLDRLTTVHGIRLDHGLTRTDHHIALKSARLAQARDTFGWTAAFLSRLR